MAITVGELLVRLGLDPTEFVRGLADAQVQIKQHSQSLQETGEVLSKAITLPLAGVASASLVAFGGFEQAMNRISAVGEIVGKDLEKLRTQAMDLGAKTQYSAKQAADAMGNFAASGFKATEIFQAMPGVLALAATENMKIADAAQIAADTLKGYGLAAQDTQMVADILAKTSAASATSVKDLGTAFSYVGPVAKALKVPMLDVAAALGVLGDAGVRGERGGTALRNILNDIVAPSKAGAGALKDLKIATKDLHGNLLPLEQLFKNLTPLLTDAAAAQAVFGQRWSEVIPLITNGGEAFRKTREEISAFEGAAKKMADVIRKGLAGNWEEFTSGLETVGIKLGEVLAPYANQALIWGNKILDTIGKMVDAFKGLPDGVQTAVLGFTALAAAAGPMLIAISSAGVAFSTLAGGFKTISDLLTASKLITAFFTLEGAAIALGVALVGLEVKWIIEDFIRIGEALDGLLPSWKEVTEYAVMLRDTFMLLHPEINLAIDFFKDLAIVMGFSDQVKYLSDTFGGLWTWVSKNWGQVIMTSIMGPFDLARRAIKQFADQLEQLTGQSRKVTAENLDVMSAGLKRLQASAASAASAVAKTVTSASFRDWKSLKTHVDDASAAFAKHNEERKKTKKVVDAEAVAIKGALETQRNMVAVDKILMEHNSRAHRQLMTDVQDYLGKVILDWQTFHSIIGDPNAWKKPNDVMNAMMAESGASLQKAIERTKELDGAFKTLGVSSTVSLEQVRNAAKAAYDTLKQGMATGEIEKSQTALMQGQVKLLQAERELAIARGESAAAYDAQLSALGVNLTKLGVQNKVTTDEWKQLWNQVSTIVNDLGKDITDAILSGKNLGDVFINTIEAMGKAVLRFVVEGMVNGLIKSITTGTNGFAELGKVATSAFNKIRQIFTGSTTDAAGSVIKNGTDAAGGGAVKSATGALSGGLTGMVTAVGSAVSAVTGVLQYLQGRRMEQDIGRIEVSTREIKAELINLRADEWKREVHLFKLSAMADATNRFGDAHGAYLSDILGTLTQIRDLLISGVSINGSGEGEGRYGAYSEIIAGATQGAVHRLQELADQTHMANYFLGEMSAQAQVTQQASAAVAGGFTEVAASTGELVSEQKEAAVAVGTTAEDIAKAGQELVDKFGVASAEYAKWKEALTEKEKKAYEQWLQARMDAEKRALRSTDRWGNVLDEFGNTVQYGSATLAILAKSVSGTTSELNGAMTQLTDVAVLGSEVMARTWADLEKQRQDNARLNPGSMGIVPGNVLGSTMPATVPANPVNTGNIDWSTGSNISIGGRPLPTRFEAASSLTLNVTVNNADSRKVANEMVAQWRSQGVDI